MNSEGRKGIIFARGLGFSESEADTERKTTFPSGVPVVSDTRCLRHQGVQCRCLASAGVRSKVLRCGTTPLFQ